MTDCYLNPSKIDAFLMPAIRPIRWGRDCARLAGFLSGFGSVVIIFALIA